MRFRPLEVPREPLDMTAYLQFILDSIQDPDVVQEFLEEEYGEDKDQQWNVPE